MGGRRTGFACKIIQFTNVVAGITETQQQEDGPHSPPPPPLIKALQPAEVPSVMGRKHVILNGQHLDYDQG